MIFLVSDQYTRQLSGILRWKCYKFTDDIRLLPPTLASNDGHVAELCHCQLFMSLHVSGMFVTSVLKVCIRFISVSVTLIRFKVKKHTRRQCLLQCVQVLLDCLSYCCQFQFRIGKVNIYCEIDLSRYCENKSL